MFVVFVSDRARAYSLLLLYTLFDERCHGMRGIREPPPRDPPNAAQGETFAQAALVDRLRIRNGAAVE